MLELSDEAAWHPLSEKHTATWTFQIQCGHVSASSHSRNMPGNVTLAATSCSKASHKAAVTARPELPVESILVRHYTAKSEMQRQQ